MLPFGIKQKHQLGSITSLEAKEKNKNEKKPYFSNVYALITFAIHSRTLTITTPSNPAERQHAPCYMSLLGRSEGVNNNIHSFPAVTKM